ncbi:NUDIX hydrolase [Metabacillus sp. GX 13764]|uniref:NUDIX domain-containing protein n=1 Tax=Metabacillus kandeliae TaxID=2900151 RepID=UPI001E517DB9|nr:NUDIX hydrolase [Metabacillus kandeliae]MCD7036236.1 NUDIX hydrolase [Metabacillus kandeliae]
MEKRGNVWLAAAGLVTDQEGKWLVVKKKYGGLKGKWSLPAGFVNHDETLDQAILREIKEETGVEASLEGLIGIRTGVLQHKISDNMLIFKLHALTETITAQEKELSEAAFLSPEALKKDPDSSLLLQSFLDRNIAPQFDVYKDFNPGDHFGYTAYHLFL